MNEDNDVEQRLTRYRPSGPPASLRQRIVTNGRDAKPRVSMRMSWLSAAAALLMATALHINASRTFDRLVEPQGQRAAGARAVAIDDMTALLGGGDLARRAAEQWFEASQAIAAVAASAPATLETPWIQ